MAESIVQVTEGSGKKLHTWSKTIGANTVEDEIVQLGPAYLSTYTAIASTSLTINNAALTQIFQLMAGTTLNVYITHIRVYQSAIGAAALQIFDLARLTTAGTGGTAITPNPHDSTEAASGATFMTLAGVAGAAGVRLAYGVLPITLAVPTGGVAPALEWNWPLSSGTKPLRIAAGVANGIALRNVTGAAVASVVAEVTFFEANF